MKNLKRLKNRLFGLPPHPYEKQFSLEMDLAEVNWPSKFLLIASTPRCGSHLLGHMLMDQGEYGVPLEYLNQSNFPYWYRRLKSKDPKSMFEELVPKRTSPTGNFTLKAHWHQYTLFENKINTLTKNVGISDIIWIYRRSILKQAISLAIAEQTQAWISGTPELQPAVYSFSHIESAATRINNENSQWKEYLSSREAENVFCICYEDLTSTQGDGLARLNRHLNCNPDVKLTSRTKPQTQNRNIDWAIRFKSELKKEQEWILEDAVWNI